MIEPVIPIIVGPNPVYKCGLSGNKKYYALNSSGRANNIIHSGHNVRTLSSRVHSHASAP